MRIRSQTTLLNVRCVFAQAFCSQTSFQAITLKYAKVRKNALTCAQNYIKCPNLEKIQERLKFSISLEIFNPDLQNSPQKIGVWWVARLKISSSPENFKILIFFKIWALIRESQKALETTTAMKRHKISCSSLSF